MGGYYAAIGGQKHVKTGQSCGLQYGQKEGAQVSFAPFQNSRDVPLLINSDVAGVMTR
jgi:hypothetical protein